MSNYLNQLIARQFSQQEVLHPRQGSRFEPLAGNPGPHFEPSFHLDLSGEATPGKSVNLEEPRSFGMRAKHTLTNDTTVNQLVLDPLFHEDHSHTASPLGPPQPAQEPITTVRAYPPQAENVRRVDTIGRDLLAQVGDSDEATPSSPQAESQTLEPSSVPSFAITWPAAPNVSPFSEVRPSSVPPGALPRATVVNAYTRIAKPIEPANLAPPTASGEVTASAQPETNIRITIGRIEVRAVAPPAPAPSPTKLASPKLSLDDYLRSRREGKN